MSDVAAPHTATFAEQLVGAATHFMEMLTIHVGLHHGLYEALADAGPATRSRCGI